MKINYTLLAELLKRTKKKISIPLGRPTSRQMINIRKRFHGWNIEVPCSDTLGCNVEFTKRNAVDGMTDEETTRYLECKDDVNDFLRGLQHAGDAAIRAEARALLVKLGD